MRSLFARRRMFIPRPVDAGLQRVHVGVGFAIAMLAVLVFGRELFNVFLERVDRYYVAKAALTATKAVEGRLQTFVTRLDAEAQNASVRYALTSGDEMTVSGEEARIRDVFPTALRVRLLGANVEQLLPGPFPQPGFATLDILKDAKQSLLIPEAEAHLFGHEGEHIDLVRRVDDPEGRLLGFLLVSLPIDTVTSVFQEAVMEDGYFELRQGTASPRDLVMAATGRAEGTLLDPRETFDIEGTRFHVAYMTPPRAGLLGSRDVRALGVGFVSSLLLCILLVVQWRRVTRLQAERRAQIAQRWVPEPTPVEKRARPERRRTHKVKAESANVSTSDSASPGVPSDIFRAYDIRGVVGKGLTEHNVRLIGRAIGSEARDRNLQNIVVGRDGRKHGPVLKRALIEGLNLSGCNVIDIGMVTSPMLYYATYHLDTSCGVMVTGSHNPPEYNGLKIMLGGETLSEAAIRALHSRIEERRFRGNGGHRGERHIADDYLQRIKGSINIERKLKVVVDCGNGAGGSVAPAIFEALGCEVAPLYCEVDGDFPHHHPDPSIPENLRDLTMTIGRIGADIGLAFDGDADRLGLVTPSGKIIWPDRTMMLLARDILERNPGAPIIFDVKCSRYLADVILEGGGQPVMWRTGHSLIKQKMKELDAPLAGEMSGHIFFGERWYGFDDAIYAAARVLEILAADSRGTDEVFDELPEGVSTPELKIPMGKEGGQFEFMEKFAINADFGDASVTTIDGIRADWPDGWGLIRCSNTTPNLVLRFEADNHSALSRIQEAFREQILALDPNLDLPF